MTLFDSLWDELKRIRYCRFVSRSHSPRATGWGGSGSGDVTIEVRSSAVLIFRESGLWRPDSGRDLRFSNVYRWTRQDESVRLEHLRFGESRPVYLFDLAPAAADGVWISQVPHQCGEDRYSATLQPDSGCLFLAWTVTGPEKKEEIEYIYSPSTDRAF